jgi:hypothetical protein
MGLIADGLIFRGLIGPFRLVTKYSAGVNPKNKTIARPSRNPLLRYRLSKNSRDL